MERIRAGRWLLLASDLSFEPRRCSESKEGQRISRDSLRTLMRQNTHLGTCRVRQLHTSIHPELTPVLVLAMSLAYTMGLLLADVRGSYELYYYGRALSIPSVRTASLGLLHNPVDPQSGVLNLAAKDAAAQTVLYRSKSGTNLQGVNFQS